MKFKFKRSYLKVYSSICANLAAFWFLATFVASDKLILISDMISAIVAAYLATRAEDILEEL